MIDVTVMGSMFNSETFTLNGGSTTTRTLKAGESLTLKVDGKVYTTKSGEKYENKTFASCQGQGNTTTPPTTPSTPVVTQGQGSVTGVASLPYTGSALGQIMSVIALVAAAATAAVGYAVQSRRSINL